MRSSTIISVLFGAGALATPAIDRRALKVEDVYVTVTDYVTEGAQPAPTPAAPVVKAAAALAPAKHVQHHAHNHYHKQEAAVASAAPAPAAPAPKESSSSAAAAVKETKPTPKAAAPAAPKKAAPSPKAAAQPVKAAAPKDSGDAPKKAVDNLDSGSQTYQDISLQHHNVHRQNHSVPALTWNDTLAGYAKTVAESCDYAHNRDPGNGNAPYPQGYGQNIAAGINPGQVAKVVSNMWYNGEEQAYPTPYGSDSPDMTQFEVWGHYSQAVWAETESVGCYTSSCAPAGTDPTACKPDGTPYLGQTVCGQHRADGQAPVPAYFTVCNYYPSGNVVGGYHNVKQPGSMGTVCMDDKGVVTGM